MFFGNFNTYFWVKFEDNIAHPFLYPTDKHILTQSSSGKTDLASFLSPQGAF